MLQLVENILIRIGFANIYCGFIEHFIKMNVLFVSIFKILVIINKIIYFIANNLIDREVLSICADVRDVIINDCY